MARCCSRSRAAGHEHCSWSWCWRRTTATPHKCVRGVPALVPALADSCHHPLRLQLFCFRGDAFLLCMLKQILFVYTHDNTANHRAQFSPHTTRLRSLPLREAE